MNTALNPLILEMTSELRQEAMQMILDKADTHEVTAATGKTVQEALATSIDVSTLSWVIQYDNQVVGVFGIRAVNGWGVPWLLATDRIKEFKQTFLMESKGIVSDWIAIYPRLCNLIDSRHTDAIRWLQWLGFKIHTDHPTKLHDPAVDFFLFTMDQQEGAEGANNV